MFQIFKDITDDILFITLEEKRMKKMGRNKTNTCGYNVSCI